MVEECSSPPHDVLYKNSNLNIGEILYELRGHEHKWRNEPIRVTKKKLKTWQGLWMVRRMWDQETEVAVNSLKQWVHKTREEEVTAEVVGVVNGMTENDALWYLNNLKMKLRYIHTYKGKEKTR